MKKSTSILLAVLLVAALVAGGVFMSQKGDIQKKVDDLTAQVTTLTGELDAAKSAAAAAAEEAAALTKQAEELAAQKAQEAEAEAAAAAEEAAAAEAVAAQAAATAEAAAAEAAAAEAAAAEAAAAVEAISAPEVAAAEGTAEIAMVTDIGTIDDKSFNQGTWEGIVAYAEANGKTYNYYQPTAQSTEIYLDFIEQAVNGGAKVLVTPGYLFEEPIFIAQDMYPDVHFILIDGNPHNADYSEYRTNANAVGIVFAEEQAGFLAGYASVKDGYTKLGFMGGMAVPAVIRFGYGFVQGAELAAEEMGIEGLQLNYHYTGGFAATPEAQALAASWYADGIEVIFGCGGAVGNSVMAAAEAAGGKVIGVDVDQSIESETVITSATKGLGAAVEQTLTAFYAGTFPAGEAQVKDASQDGVGLPMAASKFNTFTQADYDTIYAKLVAGEVTLKKDTDVTAVTEIPVARVTVTEIK